MPVSVSNIVTMIILASVVLLAGACSSGSTRSGELYPTVTVLPSDRTITPQPTSTIAPIPTPDITESGDFLEGMHQMEQNNFEPAVAAFRRAYQGAPDNESVRVALADAYLKWGHTLILNSEAKPERLSEATDKFVSGLTIAPEGSEVYAALEREQQAIEKFLQALLDLEELRAAGDDVSLQAQQEQASKVLELFAAAYADYPELPGLRDSYGAALLLAAEITEDIGDAQETRAAREAPWKKAKSVAEQGLAIVPAESDTAKKLNALIGRVEWSLNPPTPVPTAIIAIDPSPDNSSGPSGGSGGGGTRPVQALVEIPDVSGADVGQAQSFLQQRGLSPAVSPLPPGQDGSWCNGQVSYTSPPKGTFVSPGTTVVLFYRSWDQPNPPGC